MLRKLLIIFILAAVILLGSFNVGMNQALSRSKPTATPSPTPKPINKYVLWSLIQNWRIENNLQPYIENQIVCEIAEIRLKDVARNFSHDGFKETAVRYSYTAMGENLARKHRDEDGVLKGWLVSPKHLENLNESYTSSCLATDGNHVVHIFMTP